eukprot:tig00021015_g17158.t1
MRRGDRDICMRLQLQLRRRPRPRPLILLPLLLFLFAWVHLAAGQTAPDAPASVSVGNVRLRTATVTVALGLDGGSPVQSVAASCERSEGGTVDWTGQVAVGAGDAQALLSATDLALNTTYSCSANATNASFSSRSQIYDVDTDVWTAAPVSLPSPTRGIACAWDGASFIYCSGGVSDANSYEAAFWSVPLDISAISALPSMPSPLCCHALAHFGGFVWVTGGQGPTDLNPDPTYGATWRWSAGTGWAQQASVTSVAFGANVVSARIANKWYVLPDQAVTSGGTILETDLDAAGSSRAWRTAASLPSIPTASMNGSVVGACGELLLWAGRGFKPVLIDPQLGAVVASDATPGAVVDGPAFDLAGGAYGSDASSCLAITAAGLATGSIASAHTFRISGSYATGDTPTVHYVSLSSIASRSASVTVFFRYTSTAGAAVTEAAASCSSNDGGLAWTASSSVAGGAGWATFSASGLWPNTTYTCSANATNSYGTSGDYSFALKTPAEAPAAPASVVATTIWPRNATVTVAFGFDGADSITTASLSCWSGATGSLQADLSAAVSPGASSANFTLTGLLPNTTYNCRANASNSVGTSPSAEGVFATAAELPAAPLVTVEGITSRNATLTVIFGDNGGAWIYLVAASCRLSSGGGAVWGESAAVNPGVSSASFSVVGLYPGSTYLCSANVTTSAGTSPSNTSAPFTTFAEPPDAPARVAVSAIAARTATLTVTFGGNGGAAISGASASCSLANEIGMDAVWTASVAASGSSAVLSVSGLSPNTTYICAANASNAAGTGPSNTSSPFTTTAEAPAAPVAVNITR